MKVEAIKVNNGFLIPDTDFLSSVKKDRIFLDIHIWDDDDDEQDVYHSLDALIGLCETNRTDASVNHDSIIYGERG